MSGEEKGDRLSGALFETGGEELADEEELNKTNEEDGELRWTSLEGRNQQSSIVKNRVKKYQSSDCLPSEVVVWVRLLFMP